MREEILELMEFYDGNNIIINDYIENLNSIQNMKIEQVHAYIKDLDFSHSCVTKILPNDSI